MVEEGISVIPLRFDDSPIPEVVEDLVWGDGRTEEGLIRALNRAASRWGLAVPMEPAQILERHKKRLLVSYGIRLVPTESMKKSPLLGPPERNMSRLVIMQSSVAVPSGKYSTICGSAMCSTKYRAPIPRGAP